MPYLAEIFLSKCQANGFFMWTHQGNSGRKEQTLFMNTLSACMNKAATEGYSECFIVTSRGLYAISKGRYYRPEQVQLIDTYRCETQGGTSAEPAAMYAIETSDGLKGTLVDTPTTFSEGSANEFIREAEDIRKQFVRHNEHEC